MSAKDRVLILCTGNSCRSQLAEALWRARWGERWEACSAGSEPSGAVHPLVPLVLAESRVDASGLVSEPVDRHTDGEFDLVISVCDDALESCRSIPGARRHLHWPFPDPATFAREASREDALGIFRTARDAIEGRILRYRDRLQGAESLESWLRQIHDQLPTAPPPERSEAFFALVDRVVTMISEEHDVWETLPKEIFARYAPLGWAWNGFYVLRGRAPERRLELGFAAGPPVCASVEEQPGGLGSSGMCFDAILSGQPIIAGDVGRWPGYVSCDGTSGLSTVSSIVIPIGQGPFPVAVWDLDCTEKLDPSDGVLFGALFERLAAVVPPKGW